MSLLGSRLNNLFLIFFFMKGLFMMSKRIKHVDTLFSNNKLQDIDKLRLEMEYTKRVKFAKDILHPMIIKWLNEYKELYPDKQTYSIKSLYSFIKTNIYNIDLHNIVNKNNIMYNNVKLKIEENYFPIRFVGVSEKYNTEMRINYEWLVKKYLNK